MFRSWVEIRGVVALELGPWESCKMCTADLAAGPTGGKGGAQRGRDLSLGPGKNLLPRLLGKRVGSAVSVSKRGLVWRGKARGGGAE